MFDTDELKAILDVIKKTETFNSDKTLVNIAKKIDETFESVKDYTQCLWSFHWDCGRMGDVDGFFRATKEEVENAIGKTVYFGEILGKHSEVYGTLEKGDIMLEVEDPLIVREGISSGYNPLEYLED